MKRGGCISPRLKTIPGFSSGGSPGLERSGQPPREDFRALQSRAEEEVHWKQYLIKQNLLIPLLTGTGHVDSFCVCLGETRCLSYFILFSSSLS